ncbi:DUF6499 domain-containing protein [Mesorhizobium sp. M0522]|uniref:transcriptional regulator domain-containing protein n=1 Tax=Mesorhizobium sp. M0522 TaxID=2956958 RepID=UPI003338E527
MCSYQATEFAAEYLIRNDEFVAECSQLASQFAGSGQPDLAARWGARFQNCRCRTSES